MNKRGRSSRGEEQLHEQLRVMRSFARKSSWCIFRAPQGLLEINQNAYNPEIVSIGPYHHGKKQLCMVEEHKFRYLSALLERTGERTGDVGVGLHDYVRFVEMSEEKIRGCYADQLHLSSPELVQMMVLDACFIVEVFRIVGSVIQPDPNDSFLTMPWIFPFLKKDLLMIENQIPLFVLEEVFCLSKGNTGDEAPSFSELAVRFFNVLAQRPREQSEKLPRISDAKHLLDLFRLSLIGRPEQEKPGDVHVDVHADDGYLKSIPSGTQLLLSGIICKPRKGGKSNLLDIQFSRGVLQIPPLTLDDFMSSLLLNCVAFEQCCCSRSSYITSYIIFMKCLANKGMDAELLSENQILVNYLGSHKEVATFFNDLGKVISFDIRKSYLAVLFEEVNRCHEIRFDSCLGRTGRCLDVSRPAIVSVAGMVVSAFTFLSAFYTIYAYYSPPKK